MWKEKRQNELTTNEIFDVLKQLRDVGVKRVVFSGGEAMLRSDLSSLIRNARDLNFDKITVYTNGQLLEKKARDLLESGTTTISISLDGPEPVHDMCRGINGAYQRCLEGLRILKKLRDERFGQLEIVVAMMLMKPTLDSVSHVVDLCKKYGASLAFNLYDNQSYFLKGTERSRFWITDQARLDAVIDRLHVERKHGDLLAQGHSALEFAKSYFADPMTDSVPCVIGYVHLYIDANGDVYSGCWAMSPIGNVRKRKLADMLFSKEYKERLKRMFLRECPGCTCGYAGNLLFSMPSLAKEFWWDLKPMRSSQQLS
jgi:MoaA/NifB/PqqE/SkfB family radical SAM enzyme